MTKSKRAIVLSGGGARGAYAAGILRYIVEVIGAETTEPISFDVISGTSVGAINASWLAATMDDPEYCVSRLWHLWKNMKIADAVGISYNDVWTMTKRMFRDTSAKSIEPRPGRSYAVLNTEFFSDLISREIPFHRVRKNIESGLLSALTITATDVHTGRTTVFVESDDEELPPWTRDPRRVAVAGPITPSKVLASAAIPILFPAVKIDGRWYFDGGLRQNTPISPALRMGADKLLVISLKSGTGINVPPTSAIEAPTMSLLIGKVLNSLLLDPLDYDLSFMERINGLLEHGQTAFKDEDFVEKLNEVVEAYRGQGYRIVDNLLFRPSTDLGKIAAEFAGSIPSDRWGSTVLAQIGRRTANSRLKESDFLSYLLFDEGYTSQLLDLGYADAKLQHDSLLAFFED